MSLPPGFLEELRNRLSLSQVVGRKVIWDAKKSNQAKGDMWSPCPFHTEKTASFHVDDRKGYYYCFGCHEKGDAISFVRDTENVGFMEAVEILTREAGMRMPARDPKAQEKMDRNKELADIMEQAVKFFRLQYKTAAGQPARDYITKRGLSEEIQGRFEIGFAPDGWQGLWDHLTGKGVKEDQILQAGLAKASNKGKKPYDTFRNRIMFPIRDARGRAIAFGGRAMDPADNAKYLNSPETPLFNKGRTLYNHAPAREAAGKSNALIVAEGYMDVIALAQFGFDHAVAPLGTAITENQLALLWRIHPEPIIALDGDTAGLRAAMRLIDLALPLLEAGKSLRFSILPQGMDPDDFLKEKGANAMQELLDGARPMVDLLWEREIEGKNFDSPERRAALDAELRKSILLIKDKSIRSHYGQAIAELRRALFNLNQSAQTGAFRPGQSWRAKTPQNATSGTKSSLLAGQSDEAMLRLRESVIIAASILNPDAALKHETALEKCPITTPDLKEIMNALLSKLHSDLSKANSENPMDDVLSQTLGYSPLDKLFELKPLKNHPFLKRGADRMKLARTLDEELEKHSALLGALNEIKEAEQDLTGSVDEGVTWRLQQAAKARSDASKSSHDTEGTDMYHQGTDPDAKQKLLDDQVWIKKKT